MTYRPFLLTAAIALTSLSSCRTNESYASDSDDNSRASTEMITQTIPAKDVRKIDTATGIKVIYTQAKNTSVTLTAPANMLKYITVTAKDGELECIRKSNSFTKSMRGVSITVTVSSPGLTDIDVSSGGSFVAQAPINMKDSSMDIDISSGGAISIASLTAGSLDLDASSGAAAKINGLTAKTVEADASSGAAISLSDVKATSARINASSGAALSIKGSAKVANLSASSGGAVNASGLKADNVSKSKSSGGAISF